VASKDILRPASNGEVKTFDALQSSRPESQNLAAGDLAAGEILRPESQNLEKKLSSMDPLDLLLADTEHLEQKIVSSCQALKSRIKDSQDDASSHDDAIVTNPEHRIQWAKNLHLEYILALILKPGTATDGLHGVKNMTEQDMIEACEIFSIKMKDLLISELMHLRSETQDPTSKQNPSNHNLGETQVKLGNPRKLNELIGYSAINPSASKVFFLINARIKIFGSSSKSKIGPFVLRFSETYRCS
jgi:hypothetical protein